MTTTKGGGFNDYNKTVQRSIEPGRDGLNNGANSLRIVAFLQNILKRLP